MNLPGLLSPSENVSQHLSSKVVTLLKSCPNTQTGRSILLNNELMHSLFMHLSSAKMTRNNHPSCGNIASSYVRHLNVLPEKSGKIMVKNLDGKMSQYKLP